MKLQTVINHELEITNINVAESYTNISISCVFKVKHSNGVKNNTITLKNLIRTSKEFQQEIINIADTHIGPDQRNDISEHDFQSTGGFDIYPSSGGKGRWYLYINKTEEALRDIRKTVEDILGRF